jgi:4-aminobutyrate aminotransferase-like enzyme
MSINLNITRDRELTDLLYQSYLELTQLQADLTELNQLHGQTAVALIDQPFEKPPEPTQTNKVLQKAMSKNVMLQRNLVRLIKLLTQNHTDASSLLNEFEKIRTSELLQSKTFALAHVIATEKSDK